MIRNLKLKKFLVNCVFPIFTQVNKIVPKDDNSILIYCANDELNDNAKALYDYLIENQYYEKYEIFCSLKNYKSHTSPHPKRVKFIPQQNGIWRYMRSKYVFYSMGKMPIKPTKKQMVINMWHGMPFKKIGLLSNINNGNEFFFTYVCAPSELYKLIMATAFGCPEENVCICGEPKTDKLFTHKKTGRNSKLIVWAPTFRKSKYLGYSDSDECNFLPLVKNGEWGELDEELGKVHLKLVVKLHPAQDLNGFEKEVMPNLEIYSSEVFEKKIGDLYELLAQSDALIADYSSVFLEYLVLDKPIGFALSDLEEYGNTRGFVFENPLEYMPGEKLYSKKDLIGFLRDVAEGNDRFENERIRVNHLVNKYQHGGNCKRILEIAGVTGL